MKKLLTMAVALMLGACADDITSNKYSSYSAYYSCDHVMSLPALYHAVNNQGMWCTITMNTAATILYFTSTTESSEELVTKNTYYKKFALGIGTGLIVGLPNIPELGADSPVVTCYDLSCSNCWEDSYVTRHMTLQESGYAKCNKCGRTYNLNDQGLVSDGESGKSLYRYRVYYSGNNLSVSNP